MPRRWESQHEASPYLRQNDRYAVNRLEICHMTSRILMSQCHNAEAWIDFEYSCLSHCQAKEFWGSFHALYTWRRWFTDRLLQNLPRAPWHVPDNISPSASRRLGLMIWRPDYISKYVDSNLMTSSVVGATGTFGCTGCLVVSVLLAAAADASEVLSCSLII